MVILSTNIKLAEEAWRWCPSLQLLENLKKSLDLQGGERGQRLGDLEIWRAAQRAVSFLYILLTKAIFKILMSSTQVTYHFQCSIPPY